MLIFSKMKLERVTVLGSIGTVSTSVLIQVGVRLHVTVQHGLVDTAVVTEVTFEWLCA